MSRVIKSGLPCHDNRKGSPPTEGYRNLTGSSVLSAMWHSFSAFRDSRQGEGSTLATTAIPATWRTDTPTCFLGSWCLRPSLKPFWERTTGGIFPYHWDNRQQLTRDFYDLRRLYESILPDIATSLNNLNETSFSIRYWRIVVGHWLQNFIQVLFDRWTTVSNACSEFPLLALQVISEDGVTCPAQNYQAYDALAVSDLWNERLFADLILTNGLLSESRIELVSSTGLNSDENSLDSSRRGLKTTIINGAATQFILRLAASRAEKLFLHEDYLALPDHVQVLYRLGEFPYVTHRTMPRVAQVDGDLRSQLLPRRRASSKFENILLKAIRQHLPVVYLEGYEQNRALANSLGWPESPKKIATAVAFNSDDLWKLYAAERVARGSKLTIIQHGGHYGTGAFSSFQDEETAIADSYLSWGWTDPGQPKVTRAPALPLRRYAKSRPRNSDGKNCLLVLGSMPRYSTGLYSAPMGPQYADYLRDQFDFIDALDPVVHTALITRIQSGDFGWDISDLWRLRYPGFEIDLGQAPLFQAARRAKLLIGTYNATVPLQAFLMGVPTVLFWRPEHWELNASARPYFDALQDAGVLQTDPRHCAHHVNGVWSNPGDWWSHRSVVEAVSEFLDGYAYRGASDPIEEFARSLHDE